jgi:hypothetical protein
MLWGTPHSDIDASYQINAIASPFGATGSGTFCIHFPSLITFCFVNAFQCGWDFSDLLGWIKV